jgi:hypothetical protein
MPAPVADGLLLRALALRVMVIPGMALVWQQDPAASVGVGRLAAEDGVASGFVATGGALSLETWLPLRLCVDDCWGDVLVLLGTFVLLVAFAADKVPRRRMTCFDLNQSGLDWWCPVCVRTGAAPDAVGPNAVSPDSRAANCTIHCSETAAVDSETTHLTLHVTLRPNARSDGGGYRSLQSTSTVHRSILRRASVIAATRPSKNDLCFSRCDDASRSVQLFQNGFTPESR